MSTLPSAIGRFEVVERIGQGGMGSLLLAWDPLLERQIAIKLLKEAGNEELRIRFTREARAVARLRHPHIVTVFDVGDHHGQPFIAMEYIQGHTLAEFVAQPEPVPVVRVLEWIAGICDGLGYAHRAGIVHRDIKPANLMVDHDGSVKILDFGIARVAESGMTQSGLLIGTLNYMSPEQLGGIKVDGRSDMFALGAVLYELLCRKQAFPGGLDSGVLGRIMYHAPDAVETLCSGIAPEVVHIVNTAMQKDPERRYLDMVLMRREVKRVHRLLGTREDRQVSARMEEPTAVLDTPVRTPHRGTAAREFVKRREDQIEQYLREAAAALAVSDFERVIASCEQALLMDPNLVGAAQMLDESRAGLGRRQAERWLAEAKEELSRGALTAAANLLDQALPILPDSDAALSLQREITEAQEVRQRARERAEALERALARAQTHFDAAEYDEVVRACDEALAIEAGNARAGKLRADAVLALEERARRAAERDARESVGRAQALAAAGRIDEGIALLDGVAPHPVVRRAQQALAAEARRLQQEREHDRRAAEAVADARGRLASGDAEGALRRLREFVPPRPAIAAAIVEIEAVVERGRKERLAAALAAARGEIDRKQYSAALSRLRPLRDETAGEPGVAQLIVQAEEALAAEERARKRDAQVAERIADAAAHLHSRNFVEAQAQVRSALALDARSAEALALQARVDEAVRVAAADAAFVRTAVAAAQAEPSHEAAIVHLREALARDPQHAAALRLLRDRETALEREQAGQQRAEKIEQARQQVAAHMAAQEWDLAEAVLSDVERRLSAKKPLKDTRALLKAERKAFERRARDQRASAVDLETTVIQAPATDGAVDSTPSRRTPIALMAAAAIVVAVALGIYLFTRGPASPVVVTGTAVLDAVPWASIEGIRSADGDAMPLPDAAATPISLPLPAGTYDVTLVGPPPASIRRQVSITVTAGTTVVAPPPIFTAIEAESYLLRVLGTTK